MINQDIEIFIEKFVKELKEENAAIFAGAGLSIPAGHLNWKELLKPLAKELNIDINRENDLVSLAQYYCNEKGGNRNNISQLIMDEFNKQSEPTENHKILARLPINTYWTTNYDRLIEKALEKEGKIVDRKYALDQLPITKRKRNAIVYKMHGDVEHPGQAIIIKDDYEMYSHKYGPFITALKGDLISKTFLFIGISFTDPNLDYILSRIRVTFESGQREHYCFLEKVVQGNNELKEEYEYRKRRQELFIGDLKRFNIKVLLLDSYREITEILKVIECKFKQDKIFISGSANEYNQWGEEKAKKFIHDLSSKLIKDDYDIISGFGIGVGSLVITGALQELYMHKKIISEEMLLLRPFPQEVLTETNRKQLWTKYREDMIKRAGITIVIFGNKVKDGCLVNADGVEEEFKIAHELGNKIIPIGATGFMAKEIWDKIDKEFETYYPNLPDEAKYVFKQLNDNKLEPEKIIDKIIEFINYIK